jgi:hypothetical protein
MPENLPHIGLQSARGGTCPRISETTESVLIRYQMRLVASRLSRLVPGLITTPRVDAFPYARLLVDYSTM